VIRESIGTCVWMRHFSLIPDKSSFCTASGTRLVPASLSTTVPKLRNRPKKYAKLANIVKRLLPKKLDLVESSAIKSLESHLSGDLAALSASIAPLLPDRPIVPIAACYC
jgi:hypothetical protein